MRAACEPLALIVPVSGAPGALASFLERVDRDVPRPFVLYAVYEAADEAGVAAGRALAASRPWLRVLPNRDLPGTVGAVRTGLREIVSGPVVVTLADAGDDLSVMPRMLALYAQGYRIVCPSRFARGGRQIGGSRLKRLLLRATGLSLRALVGFPTLDLNNNYRLYDARLVHALGVESRSGFELALELTAKAFRRGIPIAEVPTTWHDRRPGGSAGTTASWLGSYLRWCAYALRSGRRPREVRGDDSRGSQ